MVTFASLAAVGSAAALDALPCPPLPITCCRRQDDELDHLSSHVVRIGELGKEMGQELHLQGQLLDELDNGALGRGGSTHGRRGAHRAACGWRRWCPPRA